MLLLQPFFEYKYNMNIKDIFLLLAATCIFSLGFAQCPDSVHVYVDPQVICPGEVAHLSTDSIQLHCVNVGDIICVHNDYHDTTIVTPEEWTSLGLSSTYTPLSVVFYVDETCRHGWAVKVGTFSTAPWNKARSPNNETIDDFLTIRAALTDLDGYSNTILVKTSQNYNQTNHLAFANTTNPFYLPAIGQLNVLFSVKDRISQVLGYLNSSVFLYLQAGRK